MHYGVKFMEERNTITVRWSIMFTLAALVTLGTFHSIFALGAFCVLCGVLVLSDSGQGLLILTFLVPFAGIFKLSPNSTSLYTYAVLLYCCLLIFENGYFQPAAILLTLYIFAMPLITAKWHEFHYLRAIKLCCYLVILYYAFSSPYLKMDPKELFSVFIAAIILSSFVRLLDSNFLRILDYIANKRVGLGYDKARFAGLFDDPNFYTVNVVIAACLAVIMYHKKWIGILPFAVSFAVLSYFLVITYSKSAFLMAFFPVIGITWSEVKRKNGIVLLLVIYSVLAIFSYLWFGGKIKFLQIVLERFSGHSRFIIDNLTTGRFTIWKNYIDQMLHEPLRLIFGFGVKIEKYMVNHTAAHSTYLEALYSFGIAGCSLLGWVLVEISNLHRDLKQKRNFLNHIVFLGMAIMYSFIHETYTPEVLFHFILGYTALNMEIKTEEG